MQEEGVIKFELRYSYRAPGTIAVPEALNAWRSRLWQLQLIGQQPGRYGGVGFGNVSRRIAGSHAPPGHRAFLISGSQTGALARLEAGHYSLVSEWDVRQNRVIAQGPIRPSSEALTHGTLYDRDNGIRVVFHVHSPAIWHAGHRLGLIGTSPEVAYGTPEMAGEVARLFRDTDARRTGIFTMGGHEDGVIAFGADEDAAGSVLLDTLERSQRL